MQLGYPFIIKTIQQGLAGAVLLALAVPARAGNPDENKVIGELIRAQSVERYLPEIKTGMVVHYNGQKYFLAQGQQELVPFNQAQAGQGLPELEVLKFRSPRDGEKVRLKMRFRGSIVKTTARVCPSVLQEATCKPCTGNWQIKFLSTRKQGNKVPDNFLFIS